MKIVLALAFVFVAACGGKSNPEPMKPDVKDPPSGGAAAEVSKFHEVLAPRWHADKGEQRMKDTCAAMGDFQGGADAIAKATPPEGADAAKWSTGTKELTDAVGALDATCKSNDAAAFETAFHRLHEGFHHIEELSSSKGHGEHKM